MKSERSWQTRLVFLMLVAITLFVCGCQKAEAQDGFGQGDPESYTTVTLEWGEGGSLTAVGKSYTIYSNPTLDPTIWDLANMENWIEATQEKIITKTMISIVFFWMQFESEWEINPDQPTEVIPDGLTDTMRRDWEIKYSWPDWTPDDPADDPSAGL